MKIVIAPDSFKDALRARQAAQHIASGLTSIMPGAEIDLCPVSDGGEGFAAALGGSGLENKYATAWCIGPLGQTRSQPVWVLLKSDRGKPATAVLELASVCGLEMVPADQRDPTRSTTFGLGQLIAETLRHGAKTVVLGIGGSATNDAGCGIAQALGARFFDKHGAEITTHITGGDLQRIASIDRGSVAAQTLATKYLIACDVTNPLTGPNGAAHIYAPQKGATPEQVEQLDAGLRHIAKLWREQLGVDVEQMPGAGAAGGVGGGMVAMLGAKLVPGAELVLDTIGFDQRINDADLVITGEGRLDAQSLSGKAVMAVARRCKAMNVPCVALVGCVGEGAEQTLAQGLTDYIVIGEGLDPAESIRRTGELLERAAARVAEERLN